MELLVGLAWLAAGGAPAAAEQRIALVIANAAYPTAPLANPLRDAKRVSEALEAVGFTVEQATDLAQVDMRSALSLFAARLSGADTVALFYYAGHAVQLGGENYLLPVDSPFKTEADVRLSGIRLDQILYAMRPQKSRLSIAVLDACRDNPFPALSRSVGRGLAPVNAPAGTLVAFSTAPGSVALDGAGLLSPYAKAFADALAQPGLDIEDVFKTTRIGVMRETGADQVPWEHSSLVGRFVFRPAGDTPPGVGEADRQSLPDARPPGAVASAKTVYAAGLRLEQGDGVRRNLKEAREKFEQAAAMGHARAHYRLFLHYEEGRGVPRDSDKAAGHLLEAYKAGDGDAERVLDRHSRRLRMATRRAVQRRLAATGHFSGVADGVFGRRTHRAIEAYRGE